MSWQKEIDFNGLILTLFITGLSIIIYSFPRLSDLFGYDRQAILNGEIWRLFTAPLVHFSKSHILWNILVFAVAGFAISVSGFPCLWIVCGFAAVAPGLIFIMVCPDLEYYGGLSGLATAAATYFCLCSMVKTRINRGVWLIILVFMGIKILIETVMGESVFVQAENIPFRVLPLAHITGFLGALATVAWDWSGISMGRKELIRL